MARVTLFALSSLLLCVTGLHGSPLGFFSHEDLAFLANDLRLRRPPAPKPVSLDEVASLWEATKPWPAEEPGPTDIAGFYYVRALGKDALSTPHARRVAPPLAKRDPPPVPLARPIKRLIQVVPKIMTPTVDNLP